MRNINNSSLVEITDKELKELLTTKHSYKKKKLKPTLNKEELLEIECEKHLNKVRKKKYYSLVLKLTESNKHLIEDVDKRKFRKFDIDHKISIKFGFENNIAAENIADITNLHIIPHKANAIKGNKNIVDDSNKWILIL